MQAINNNTFVNSLLFPLIYLSISIYLSFSVGWLESEVSMGKKRGNFHVTFLQITFIERLDILIDTDIYLRDLGHGSSYYQLDR